MRYNRAGVLGRVQHRAFDMDMAVDKAGREVSAPQVDDLASFRIIADARDATIVHCNAVFFDAAGEDIDDAGVLEYQVRRFIAARHCNQVGQAHFILLVHHSI